MRVPDLLWDGTDAASARASSGAGERIRGGHQRVGIARLERRMPCIGHDVELRLGPGAMTTVTAPKSAKPPNSG